MSDLLTEFSGAIAGLIEQNTTIPTSQEQIEAMNSSLHEITEAISGMMQQPEFVGTILSNLGAFEENEVALRYASIYVSRAIKLYWHNKEQIVGKDEIRPLLLQALFQYNQSEVFLNNIVSSIGIVAESDYPTQWPDFNETLTTTLMHSIEEEPNLYLINAILVAATEVFKKFEIGYTRSDDCYKKLENAIQYWGAHLPKLLTETLANEEIIGEEIGFLAYVHCLQVYRALISQELNDNFIVGLPSIFETFKTFNETEGVYDIKTEICILAKMFIFRYLTEILSWAKKCKEVNGKEVSEEEDEAFIEQFFNMLDSIIALFGDEELPVPTAIAAFKALTDVVKAPRLREDYLTEERFGAIWEAIQNALNLSDDQVDNITEDPVQYFKNDVGGIEETESTRKAAFDFMKTLAKYYREQINGMFEEIYDKSLPEQFAADNEKWVDYDRVVFFTGFVASAHNSYRDGVTEIIEGFDLEEFVNLFILPVLTPDFQFKILQADAVKFYVDYRNIIPAQLTADNFQLFLDMMKSESIATKLYGSYLVERLCAARLLGINAEFLASKDISKIITPLISSLIYANEPVESLASTLKRLIVVGAEAIASMSVAIVKSLLSIVTSGQRNPSNAGFYHNIWEAIAACVVYTGVNISDIEEPLITALDDIITNNSVDFVPYAIQMYGAMVQGYPPEVEPNPTLIQHFVEFLAPDFWIPFGNIPALAMLITHFAHRVPAVVSENEGRILEICNDLLGNSRTQMCAFQIFMALITKEEVIPESVGSIVQMVLDHLSENIPKYRTSFALFFCNASFILGADNFISGLPDLEIFKEWGDSIPSVRQRNDIENAIAGGLSVLEATSISNEAWAYIFCGIVNLLERPSREDTINEEIMARKAEEEAATQFDTTFSRLVYAEKSKPLHEELKGEDLIKYFTVRIAEISQAKPGLIEFSLGHAELIKPLVRDSFLKYQEKYEVQFA